MQKKSTWSYIQGRTNSSEIHARFRDQKLHHLIQVGLCGLARLTASQERSSDPAVLQTRSPRLAVPSSEQSSAPAFATPRGTVSRSAPAARSSSTSCLTGGVQCPDPGWHSSGKASNSSLDSWWVADEVATGGGAGGMFGSEWKRTSDMCPGRRPALSTFGRLSNTILPPEVVLNGIRTAPGLEGSSGGEVAELVRGAGRRIGTAVGCTSLGASPVGVSVVVEV